MSAFIRNLAIVLAALSAVTGLFIGPLLSLLAVNISIASECRWLLIVGMPGLLFVSFTSFNLQPAKDALDATLQSIGLIAIFLSPYWWIVRHAE
jgi:hypothetical protein